ncbi:General secretion pathway protein M [plant metagenome]|uniref:General secretion pathway protein M n=1 Tax=plant metagenome TaxID=1297885 RepID=A0A484SCX2_9ZZZZ
MNSKLSGRLAVKLPVLPPAWRQRWHAARDKAAARWRQLTSREQALLAALGAILLLALVVQLAVRPALNDIARSGAELPRLRAQAAQVDAMVQEAQALQGAVRGRIPPAELGNELAASLAQAGLNGEHAVAAVADSADPAWDLRVSEVSAAALFNWLATAPAQFRLSLQSGELARSEDAAGKPMAARLTGTLRLVATGEGS